MSVITYSSKAPDLILPVTHKTTSTKHLSSVKHKQKTKSLKQTQRLA